MVRGFIRLWSYLLRRSRQGVDGDDHGDDAIFACLILDESRVIEGTGFTIDDHGRRLGLTTDMPPKSEIHPRSHVIASLLIDPNGRVRDGESSRSLSSPADRERFLSLRQWGDCIVIGSRTESAESYRRSRLPVVVYSRGREMISDWQVEMRKLRARYGDHVLVEAGPGILHQLIEQGALDQLFLTRTSRISTDKESPLFDLKFLGSEHGLQLMESTEIEAADGSVDRFETYRRSELT